MGLNPRMHESAPPSDVEKAGRFVRMVGAGRWPPERRARIVADYCTGRFGTA
jgi:hypothetical protein